MSQITFFGSFGSLVGFGALIAHVWYADGATEIFSGEMVIDSTVGQPILYPDGNTFCGTEITSPGLLYVIEGDGESLTIDTCSDETNFNSKISVYSGADLSETDLVCIGGADDSGFSVWPGFIPISPFPCTHGVEHPLMTIATTSGTYYYILVHGSGTQTGAFELTAFLHLPALDIIPLVYGLEHEGTCTTVGQPVLYPIGTNDGCGTTIEGSGVLHVIKGTGGPITADTCSFETSYDTKMSIYSGPDLSGTDLICLTGRDDIGDSCESSLYHTQLRVNTDRDLYYYILVHGWSGLTGRYQLEVTNGTHIATPICPIFDPPSDAPTAEPTTAEPTEEPTAQPIISPSNIFLESCETDPCDCSDDEVDPFCRTCHYPDGPGCSKCKWGYFKLDYNYPCANCKEVFGPGCKFCQDFNGCGQCKRNYVRRYDGVLDAYYCVDCHEIYGEGCKVCQEQGCGQCKRGYQLITNEQGVNVCV